MKKQLEIPEEMNRKVKVEAAKADISANEYILIAIREKLGVKSEQEDKPKKEAPAKLPDGVTTGNRVVTAEDKQFGLFRKVEGHKNITSNGKCFKQQLPGKPARYKYTIEEF